MIDATGSVGLRNWRGHLKRADRTMGSADYPGNPLWQPQVSEGSAAHVISNFRDRNGHLMDLESAGVELINVLRPTVANARYVVFAAMALHAHPEWRDRVRASDEALAGFRRRGTALFPLHSSDRRARVE